MELRIFKGRQLVIVFTEPQITQKVICVICGKKTVQFVVHDVSSITNEV